MYQKFTNFKGIKEKKKAEQGKRGWECCYGDSLQD